LLQFIDQTQKYQQLPGNGTRKLRMSENESDLWNSPGDLQWNAVIITMSSLFLVVFAQLFR
jgi:hypothetical protein